MFKINTGKIMFGKCTLEKEKSSYRFVLINPGKYLPAG